MINDYQELQDRTDENEKRHPVTDYQESQKKGALSACGQL